MESASNVLLTRDFSSVEDAASAFNIIRNIAYRAGKSPAAEAAAGGLPHIFSRGNQIKRIHQNSDILLKLYQ